MSDEPKPVDSPYYDNLMRENAEKCVKAALKSMGILANSGDDQWKVILVVRSVAATYAAAHLPPHDHNPFFTHVAKATARDLKISPESRIIMPR